MTLIRNEKCLNYFFISADDVLEFGFEKASILANITQCSSMIKSFDEWYSAFPFIEKDRFYCCLDELIKDGHLTEK